MSKRFDTIAKSAFFVNPGLIRWGLYASLAQTDLFNMPVTIGE
jgi:hypothetical protein